MRTQRLSRCRPSTDAGCQHAELPGVDRSIAPNAGNTGHDAGHAGQAACVTEPRPGRFGSDTDRNVRKGLPVPLSISYSQGLTSAWSNVATFVPKLVAFLIIVIIGYFI
ncbi:MAG TPA: hypothetical protein VGG50_12400, partial [Streptosporangiaceae bacterium]